MAQDVALRTTDYRGDETTAGARPRWLHRAWSAEWDRAEALLCRLLGHAPQVGNAGSRHRWVECGRCLARPVNTSRLFYFTADTEPGEVARLLEVARDAAWGVRRARLRAEVAAGGTAATLAAHFRGPGTDDYAVRVTVGVPGLGTVYLSADGFFRRLFERLPLGADREVGLHVHDGAVHWNLWHSTTFWSSADPRGRCGSWHPATTLLGRVTIDETVLAAAVPCVVPMPEGTYEATATLTQVARRRARARRRVTLEAHVECAAGVPVPGNPESDFYDGDDAIHGKGVLVDGFDDDGEWLAVAVGAFATAAMRARARYGSASWAPAANG